MTTKNSAKVRAPQCHPDRKHKARGLCASCYKRALSIGAPFLPDSLLRKGPLPRTPDCHPGRKHAAGGLCMPCYNIQSKIDPTRSVVRKKAKAAYQRRHLTRIQRLRRYGLTPEAFASLSEKQGHVCAICFCLPLGKRPTLCVDHCHTTGRVRGLLCSACNVAIGYLRDDPERLLSAITYVLCR